MEKPLSHWQLHVRTVRKSSGMFRRVVEPRDGSLVRLQKKLKEFLDKDVLNPHPSVHGFTRGRGPYTNAVAHLGAQALLTVDISDFFASISALEVEATLREFGATPEVALGITNVGTFESVLATGFSTSPVLSNMYFREIDNVLSNLAGGLDLTYTRYADDLTFSGDVVNDRHLAEITAILESKSLRVNEKKVRFQRSGHPQLVTGYVIAHKDRPRVSRHFKRQLRLDLHYTNRFGIEHQAGVQGEDPRSFAKQLTGRISYLMCSDRDLASRLREEFGHLLEHEEDVF